VLTREGISVVVDVAQTEPNSKTKQNEKAKKTGGGKKKEQIILHAHNHTQHPKFDQDPNNRQNVIGC